MHFNVIENHFHYKKFLRSVNSYLLLTITYVHSKTIIHTVSIDHNLELLNKSNVIIIFLMYNNITIYTRNPSFLHHLGVSHSRLICVVLNPPLNIVIKDVEHFHFSYLTYGLWKIIEWFNSFIERFIERPNLIFIHSPA